MNTENKITMKRARRMCPRDKDTGKLLTPFKKWARKHFKGQAALSPKLKRIVR